MARAQTIVLAEGLAGRPTASSVLRWTGVGALAAALFAGPLLLGGAPSWAWAALWACSAAAFLITVAVWIVEGRATMVLSPVPAIAAVVAAVAAAQLIPLPPRLLGLTGGRTQEIHRTLSGLGLERASLAPADTVQALVKAALVLMASVSTLALPRARRMLFVLAAAVAASAVVASAAGIIQENGTSEKIFGLVDLTASAEGQPLRSAALDPALSSGIGRIDEVSAGAGTFFRRSVNVGDVFGPYANSNHFGGLIEIALPVMFALLLGILEAGRGGWRDEGGFARTTEGNLALLLGFAVLLGVAALVCSHSFGAAGGLALGLMAVAATFSMARRRAVTALAIIAGLAAAAAAAFALRPGIAGLLPSVLGSKFAGRFEIWRATGRAALDFPIIGSGLGTFASVMPHYETTEAKAFFAHNDYLQAALEAGLPVALLLGVLASRQLRTLARGAARNGDLYCAALSAGAAGALAAIAFHSFFDFNLQVPANALSLAVVACVGAVAARATRLGTEAVGFEARILFSGRRRIIAASALAVLLVAAGAAAVTQIVRADISKEAARRALAQLGPRPSGELPKWLAAGQLAAGRAAAVRSFDAEAHYLSGELCAARAEYETDADRQSTLRQQSVREIVAAARLSPAYTYYALSAVTMGVNGNGVVEKWPMSSFAYLARAARTLFDGSRDKEGLAFMRSAFDLAAGDAGGLSIQSDAAVADLLKRFGTYERISAAVPDSFGGHLVLARGLSAAGVNSAATQEYASAAARAAVSPNDKGLSERSAAEVAQALAGGPGFDGARALYETVLAAHPRWQYLRLTYARFLAGAGKAADANAQIDLVLSSSPAKWLEDEALSVRKTIAKK
jgi:O-antigen ligase